MKRTILIGAGASMPYYSPALNTNSLTNAVRDIDNWTRIINEYNLRLHKNIVPFDLRLTLDFIRRILDTVPDLNFEEIIEMIDKICSYYFDDQDNKIFHKILSLLHVQKLYNGQQWEVIPFFARQIIAEEIIRIDTTQRVINYQDLINLQSDFINYVTEKEGLAIISLNYDNILNDSLSTLNFETGYLNRRFNVNRFITALNTISYPHGHLLFSYDSDGIRYNDSIAVANDYRFDNLFLIDRNETKVLIDSNYSYNFNTFIVSGQAKESTFDNNPYTTYYQKMAIDFYNSNEIYLIGYSFSDLHLNRLISNFLEINVNNKIIIVGYQQNNIELVNEFISQNIGSTLSTRILKLLNMNSLPLDGRGRYIWQDMVEYLNQNHYGRIHPRIFIYKDGYEQFLNNYQTFIDYINANP